MKTANTNTHLRVGIENAKTVAVAARRLLQHAYKRLNRGIDATRPASPERNVVVDQFFAAVRRRDAAEAQLSRARYAHLRDLCANPAGAETFAEWLRTQRKLRQYDADDPVYCVAIYASGNRPFQRASGSLDELVDYMRQRGACDGAIDQVRRA